jgi:hypothetical protein
MAERIVSPGVFTRERDLSFLPQGIADIGAAIVGPTVKGPAFVPTIVRSFQEFESIFGSTDSRFYTPYTVQNYLQGGAGTVTIVRVLGLGGYTNDYLSIKVGTKTVAILKPSRGGTNGTVALQGSGSVTGTWATGTLTVSSSAGNISKTISFNTSSADYIENVISSDPQVQTSGQDTLPVYLHKNFKTYQSSISSGSSSMVSGSDNLSNDYSVASTPSLQSQLIAGARYNLFKVNTRSHGTGVNDNFKIAISNVKAAGSVAGSDYGSFTMALLKNNPGQNDDGQLIESWDNMSFDKASSNFFARVIGDRYVTTDSAGKLTYNGDWPNRSNNIYVSDFSAAADGSLPVTCVPMGHASATNPAAGTTTIPAASFISAQNNAQGEFDSNVYFGWEFAADDNKQYLAPLPSGAGSGSNVSMSLEDMFGNADASTLGSTYSGAADLVTLALSHIKQRKFVVPFQGGFDGDNPANPKSVGNDISATNTQGFDCSTAAASGSVAFKRAINAVSNPDEFDINLLVTPGIVHAYHPKVTNHSISTCESRGDAFYVFDGSKYGETVDNAIGDISTLDTNYAATYFPWVKVLDDSTNQPTWVPPSVVLPGIISYTDQVAHEWFAPAGLNRGGLTQVLEAKTRLTHSERDTLYEDRVNPIASFPGQGVVVWGQKTLQAKPSALDRVNVRRLLIKLKKFIASSSRYLVFEQNSSATRNRFMNVVNPFLESVQQNSGLSAFKVVMDDSNNTPDVVDRNQLVGQIFIQPTRTAEFIVLDFSVMPTGATFPE